MPATRNGRATALAVVVGLLVLFLVIPMILSGLYVKTISDSGCGGTGPTGGPESADARDIPSNYLALYHKAEDDYGVPWNVLAGIGTIETNHGRSTLAGVHSGANFAGAAGPMQIGIAGAAGNTWGAYGADGNDDGKKDVYDPEDAIPAAAKYLVAGGAPEDLHRAILSYNHAEWYVAEVMAWARKYAKGPTLAAPNVTAPTSGSVAAFGDSVMLGSADALKEAVGADVDVDAVVGRQPDASIDAIDAYKRAHHGLPDTLIVQIGNNGPVTQTLAGRLRAVARDAQRVVLVTVRVDRPWEKATNRQLKALAARWPAVTVADWNAAAVGHDDYLRDGVHPTPMGQAVYVQTIAKAVGATAAPAAGCPVGEPGVPGKVEIAPGANFPGKPITPETLAFVARVAGSYDKTIIVTTGTHHDYLTRNGTVSDHSSGHAVDIGMAANGGADDSPVGDAIATACLIAAGDPPARAAAIAKGGGLHNRVHDGLRIQCIWKTDTGGDHHNHVHAGARPARPGDGPADLP